MSSTPMQVEVWSDVVCPWCYIGKRRLEQALASVDYPVEVIHRAFQLDPAATTEGRRTLEVIAAKYRLSAADATSMMANVEQVAASVGLDYHLEETVSGNTRDAHRVLLWAQEQGKANDLLESLYSGYFEQARPIFTAEELMPLVAFAGLDVAAALDMLGSDAYVEQVRADQELAASFGATGVPFFVFNRQYGISGAQPLEAFEQTLRSAAQSP
jgi:predicted DsbA family dithiol-disulfide isomerase